MCTFLFRGRSNLIRRWHCGSTGRGGQVTRVVSYSLQSLDLGLWTR